MTTFRIDDEYVPMQPPCDAVEVQPLKVALPKGAGQYGKHPGQSQILAKGGLIWVSLTRGYWAVALESDMPLVATRSWYAFNGRDTVYARSDHRDDEGKKVRVLMHRLIPGNPVGAQVDHIHGNGLDNRRCELRVCTVAQNLFNRGKNKNNTSGFKGVYFDAARNMFGAKIVLNRKTIHLGRFPTAERAHEAYCKAALTLHGGFAKTS